MKGFLIRAREQRPPTPSRSISPLSTKYKSHHDDPCSFTASTSTAGSNSSLGCIPPKIEVETGVMSLAKWRKSRLVRSWIKLTWFVCKWAHTLNIVYTAWEKYRVNLFLSGLEVKKTKTNLILLLTFNLPLLWLPPAPWANPSRSHLVTLIPRENFSQRFSDKSLFSPV